MSDKVTWEELKKGLNISRSKMMGGKRDKQRENMLKKIFPRISELIVMTSCCLSLIHQLEYNYILLKKRRTGIEQSRA